MCHLHVGSGVGVGCEFMKLAVLFSKLRADGNDFVVIRRRRHSKEVLTAVGHGRGQEVWSGGDPWGPVGTGGEG